MKSCAVCQKSDVKLYRPYGEFFRESHVVCKSHIPAKEKDWFVPLVEDTDGSVWGYTSSPADAMARFDSLPEA